MFCKMGGEHCCCGDGMSGRCQGVADLAANRVFAVLSGVLLLQNPRMFAHFQSRNTVLAGRLWSNGFPRLAPAIVTVVSMGCAAME